LILENPDQSEQLKLQRNVERNIKMASSGEYLVDNYLEAIK